MLESIKRSREENVLIYDDNERYICESGLDSILLDRMNRSVVYGDLPRIVSSRKNSYPNIQIVNESSLMAAMKFDKAMILNFASAIHPGGGYIRGANAQEECLCRSSILYNILCGFPEFYSFNKRLAGITYSDLMIYSPDVVFFRDDYGNLMDHVEINVLTAAAPNNRNVFEKQSVLEAIFCARIEKVLKVAIDTGNRNIILGAWGCGAFCNDPEMVAICFDAVIKSTNWDIDNIVFAIMDTHEEKLISTFRKVLK